MTSLSHASLEFGESLILRRSPLPQCESGKGGECLYDLRIVLDELSVEVREAEEQL